MLLAANAAHGAGARPACHGSRLALTSAGGEEGISSKADTCFEKQQCKCLLRAACPRRPRLCGTSWLPGLPLPLGAASCRGCPTGWSCLSSPLRQASWKRFLCSWATPHLFLGPRGAREHRGASSRGEGGIGRGWDVRESSRLEALRLV